MIWEYARAAGFDTAYWTSQNLLFGNSGAWLDGVPFEPHVNATELEQDPTLEIGADDAKLVTRVVEHLTAVAGFVAVLQQGAAGGGEFFGGGKHGIGVRETVGVEDGV